MNVNKMYGLDTETPMGKLGCIATNDEVIEATTFEEVINFLGKHRYHGATFWTFNLQFDIEHILKSTNNKPLLQEIYEFGVRRPGIEYEGCKIQYIPRKLFKVCRNKHCFTVYDIAQFYNHVSLEKAGKQYLPVEYQKDTSTVSAARIGDTPGYYEENLTQILRYCKQDAIATLALAKVIERTFTKEGISFRNPISQAKISEVYVTDHYQYPKVPDGLQDAHSWAHKSYHGGLFWTLQRGYFHEPLYSFDINSAYPAVMVGLPHWGNGIFTWVRTPSPITHHETSEPDTVYGWYAVEFDCPWIPMEEFREGYTIDICYRDIEKKITVNPKRIIYPTGTRRQVITKIEYEWMRKHHFPAKFITGLEWKQYDDAKGNKYVSPFIWMEKMYNRRKEITKTDKTGMLQYALKILLNGLYGKTAQSKKGTGRLTNFFYASHITAEPRIKVADVALKFPNEIIEIATDSVTLTKDISAEIPISNELGEWGLDEYAEGLFIGSGIRQEWRKLGGEYVTYARGLTDKRDFDLKAFLYRNREDSQGWFTRKRPIHLGEMLVHHKALCFADLGVFTSVRKRLNVNTDKKQVWDRDYENFGDFLESKPMKGKPLEVVLEDVEMQTLW